MNKSPNNASDCPHIDSHLVSEYDEQIIEYSVQRAELYIQSQQDNLTEIDNKTTTILGWLIAGISALVGYIAVYATGGTTNLRLLVLSLAALAFLSIAAAILIKSNLYKRSSYPSGTRPAMFFHKDVYKWAKTYYPSQAGKMTIVNYLQVLENRISFNDAEIDHRVKYYRICLYTISIGILLIFALSCVFLIW